MLQNAIYPFTLSLFKEKLLITDWRLLHPIKDPNEAYKISLNVNKNNCHTLGVFIDLTKVFDTEDHRILLKNYFTME